MIGENGAGQSMLITILSGAIPSESGSIELDGVSLVGAFPAQTLAAGGRGHLPGVCKLAADKSRSMKVQLRF